MSTRPRPRPRRLAATSEAPATSPSAATSTPPPVVTQIAAEDEDAMFIRNRGRTAQTWKKLKQAAETKELVRQVSGSEEGSSDRENSTPRRWKPKKKKYGKEEGTLPDWTKDSARAKSILTSDDEDDIIILSHTEAKRIANKRQKVVAETTNDRKRPRSRSRSITPPPAVPLEAMRNARDAVRQFLGAVSRSESPPVDFADDSTDTIVLDPELASIAQQMKSQSSQLRFGGTSSPPDTGGPPTVTLKVRWVPHPQDKSSQTWTLPFQLNRHQSFQSVFSATADEASVTVESMIVTYDNRRVFQSATPHSLHVWAEAELEAYTVATYEYLQTSRRQRSISVQPEGLDKPATAEAVSITEDESEPETGNESASEEDKFKLTLRSGKTKDIVLTVRPSTTCGAIVKAFLKKAGLAEQFETAGASANKGRGKKAKAPVGPMLMLDGDKLDSASAIGDADLEDGDLVEVVGF
ncbi:uncharacterized protein FIBRA_00864 [Fibroporia radiculosa]|uniref:Rad60/SUMO-like domain-containing protein n=1 Tax=Fibroporia radiculosa TaxID=599839 RepID=J4G0N2_9APHY|nr:uncharacterized protein FIBRA_00864 [Fibroporia radiculosa]CCL98858.1 predicted protein [Fibroporia radiculosa]